MRPGEQEELDRREFMAKLPSSYNSRRLPRVRLRKGLRGLWVTLGTRMTKRAAFRAAREQRDTHGEKQPQAVWQVEKHCWHFGVRGPSVSSNETEAK